MRFRDVKIKVEVEEERIGNKQLGVSIRQVKVEGDRCYGHAVLLCCS